MSDKGLYSWVNPASPEVDCVCLGTGRFLRSVLVPAMAGAGHEVTLIQTRGRSFLDYLTKRNEAHYEVDTVLPDGSVETSEHVCQGAFTMGSNEGQEAAMDYIKQMKSISVVGVGVTEGGLASSSSKGMEALYQILVLLKTRLLAGDLQCTNPRGRICVINTDNVPNNGSVICAHMMEKCSDEEMQEFLENRVSFLNTMVDRITSQRPGSNGMIPYCEPLPAKALVLLDPHRDLPQSWSLQTKIGVVVRSTQKQLDQDVALKLRIANGTHTAASHTMALCQMLKTSVLSSDNGVTLLQYLDALFYNQISVAAQTRFDTDEIAHAYQDWRQRLCHPHFGLSSFFITQNGAAKGGIRLGPTVQDLLMNGLDTSVSIAFSLAAILRWLTPRNSTGSDVLYRGWLEQSQASDQDGAEEYADGMSYNLNEGWYEFRCACQVTLENGGPTRNVADWLGDLGATQQPQAYLPVIRAYLMKSDGGDLKSVAQNTKTMQKFDVFAKAIATLYARMVAGDGMQNLLKEMMESKGPFVQGFQTNCSAIVDGIQPPKGSPLHYSVSPIPNESSLLKHSIGNDMDVLSSVVVSEVSSASTIDLHTHLLPPSHGALCLWGIDELLTYHYLVAEYFITAPASITPESFFAKNKKEQADLIWKALFVERTPISEACRGVLTTLQALGLSREIQDRDLEGVRSFYSKFRQDGLVGAEEFSETVYRVSGVRYAIMTNIPFDSNEAQYWRPNKKDYPDRYRSALRVDPLLAGDFKAVEAALRSAGFDVTLEGARQYLREWCDIMKPEYMMASTPHDFVLREGSLAAVVKKGVNEEAMKEPFAFVDVAKSGNSACDVDEDATATVIDENSDLLSEVLMKVCEERDLPVALKIGAHRGVNPRLRTAGDGVVAFADANVLARLCTRFPKVRFLATFLSRNNQHEACVLATKFRNLHIYGCWWFCNNPSMIEEITKMRVEMLGTGFTAQHSDARVLDQLIYKWSHSRSVIAQVLAVEYGKTIQSGWVLTRAQIRRDVQRLFGGSYEEFMSKSFA